MCEKVEAEGLTGYAMTWRATREEIREDLARWLEQERRDPAVTELPEGDYETRFGYAWRRRGGGPALARRAARDSRSRACGTRSDRRAGSTGSPGTGTRTCFRVVDYKTGTSTRAEEREPGRRPGAPAAALPTRRRDDPRHRRSPRAAAPRRVPLRDAHRPLQPRAPSRAMTSPSAADDLDQILATIVGGIRGGDLPRRAERTTGLQLLRFRPALPDRPPPADRAQGRGRRDARRCAQMRGDRVTEPIDRRGREQIRTALDESLCVEAGAGTGKTTVARQPARRAAATGQRRPPTRSS